MPKECYTWDAANFLWNANPYTWDDVCLVTEIVGGGGGVDGQFDTTKWSEDKKRKFITLHAKVRAQNEPESLYMWRPLTTTNSSEIVDVKITAEDIRLVIENVLNITVKI